jgi:serine/threonine-protein kinase
MQLPIVFNDRYQLIKKIGEGGLAEVFQAQDMSLGRMVAVKVLRLQYAQDPSFLVNFHREAQSAAKLNNPYIVAVYDFGQYQDRPYIVMEWIPGSDLRAALNQRGRLPLEQAVEYAIQICSAVGTAHRAGLVHGDLKPGNILITPQNQVKVTDFGLARALGASAMDEGEVVWGTPAYFAPEQASGDRVLPATDVYAIGIILYEMLSGRVPFMGEDDQDVARKQIYEAHIPVDKLDSRVPEPLARIIDAAMAKNPNERFLTADHLREALIMFKQGGFMATGPQTPISRVLGSPLQQRGPQRIQPAAPSRAQTPGTQRLDWLMLGLGLLAILAVLGLVPLLVAVYSAYYPSLPGASSAASELPPGQVRMPDIVGMEVNAARPALENMGLALAVDKEEPHPTWPVFAITQQSVLAGEAVEAGTVVNVTVSQGPPLIEMPDVRGEQFDEAAELLKSLDFVVQKYEDWSPDPPGQVVYQDPPPGSLVSNRSLATLVVSSGARSPVGANLGGQILLTAYELSRLQYNPGDSINVIFFWQPIVPPTENYTFYVHLTTPEGGIVSQVDAQPQGGAKPTSTWRIGETIVDTAQLPIPPTTAAGDYELRVGMYATGTNDRLKVVDPGRSELDNFGSLIVRTIQIVP